MTNTITARVFAPTLDAAQAAAVVRAKAPAFRSTAARLRWHPFAGFVYRVEHPLIRLTGRPQRAYTLVDRLSGSAALTDPWPPLGELTEEQRGECVADPGWNSVDLDEARFRAKRLVATATMRRNRLSRAAEITEIGAYETLWKPNWLLTGRLGDRELTVLVDGLSGGYYVVGT